MTLSGWFFLLSISVPFVACAQAAAFTIKDSGVPTASDGLVIWLDNQRVLFGGLKESSKGKSPLQYEPMVWDTAQGIVKPTPEFNQVRICVRGQFVSYFRKSLDSDNGWVLVYGRLQGDRIVEDRVQQLPKQYQVNPFSCRYYESPAPWQVKGRATTPLLEEHGYLDWGPLGGNAPSDDSRLTLYRPGEVQGVQLPIRRKGLTSQLAYEPSRKVYLIPSGTYRDPVTGETQIVTSWPKGKPLPVWFLTPEGKITEVPIPYHPFMAGMSREFLAAKTGIFVWSSALAIGGGPGNAGGYLFKNGMIQRVIVGMVHKPTVSPDGCKVAVIHDPEAPTDEAHRTTIKVKIIDLCEGGTNG